LLHLHGRRELAHLVFGEPFYTFRQEVQLIQVDFLPIQHGQRLRRDISDGGSLGRITKCVDQLLLEFFI
jgi:hypothetical protein